MIATSMWALLAGVGSNAEQPGHLGQKPLSLPEALSLAAAHNPELTANTHQVEAASGRAYQAQRWANPQLELSSEEIPVRSGSLRESKNTIGLSQAFPWPGKKRLDRHIGAAGIREAEAELSLRTLALERDVKSAFFTVLAAEQVVKVATEMAQVADSSASVAKKRVETGAAPDQELLRAEIQVEQVRAALAAFERDLRVARIELATLLGRSDLVDVPLSGNLHESALPVAKVSKKTWIENHPARLAARIVQERAALEYRRAALEPYPDVTVGVDAGREGRDDNAIIEFRLSVPLPILDTSKGRKQETRANLAIAEANLRAAELALQREWATAWHGFENASQEVTTYRERILPKAKEALRLLEMGFNEGKLGFIDLLDTQRTTAEARLTYQQKLLQMNIAYAALEALLGESLLVTPLTSQH